MRASPYTRYHRVPRKVVNCTGRWRYSRLQLHHPTTPSQLCVTVTEACQGAFSNGGVMWLTDGCYATINGVGARCCSEWNTKVS